MDAAQRQPISVLIIASDGRSAGRVETVISITIESRNRAPVAYPIPPAACTVGQSCIIDIDGFFADKERDSLVYSMKKPVSIAGMTFDETAGILSGTPQPSLLSLSQPMHIKVCKCYSILENFLALLMSCLFLADC